MPLQLAAGETDDPEFITLLNSLLLRLAEEDKGNSMRLAPTSLD